MFTLAVQRGSVVITAAFAREKINPLMTPVVGLFSPYPIPTDSRYYHCSARRELSRYRRGTITATILQKVLDTMPLKAPPTRPMLTLLGDSAAIVRLKVSPGPSPIPFCGQRSELEVLLPLTVLEWILNSSALYYLNPWVDHGPELDGGGPSILDRTKHGVNMEVRIGRGQLR